MSKASTVRPINVHGTMTPKVKADLKNKNEFKISLFFQKWCLNTFFVIIL